MLFDLYTFINIFALEREFGADWKKDLERIEKRIEKRIWSGCDENLARTLKLSNCLQLIISMVLIVLHGQYCIDSILLIDNIL